MSRVVRKENPTQILMDMREIRFENSNFVILDRYNFCQALTLNLDRYAFVEIFVEF